MAIVQSHRTGTPCWADLATTDLDGARAFYGAVLGWSFDDQGADFGGYNMCSLDGELTAGMGPLQPGGSPVPCWTLYLGSDDIEASSAAVQAAGGQVVVEPMQVGEHGHMLVAVDPTGAVFGMWQPLQHHGAGRFGETGALCWAEANSPDAGVAATFYGAISGLVPTKMEGMAYFTLNHGEKPYYGVLQMTEEWAGIPPHWSVYFVVDDADATAVQVAELGGRVHHGPFDTPFGRILVCADPQGAMVTLIQLPEGA